MSTVDGLTRYLTSRSPDGLARILSLRPDARAGAPVDTVAELAGRLSTAESLHRVMQGVPETSIRLIHAMLGFGPSTTRSALLDFIDFDDPDKPDIAEFDDALRHLSDRAVAWPGADDRWYHDPVLETMVGRPLNLGIPVRAALAGQDRQRFVDVSRAWGLPTTGSTAQLLDRLVAIMTDHSRVRAEIAAAPAAAGAYLEVLAAFQVGEGPPPRDPSPNTGEEWAIQHGLLTPGRHYTPELTVEPLLAVRHDRVRLRFVARPPELRLRSIDPNVLRSGAAAAAADAAASVAALIDRLGRHPAAGLKAGGIGSRELVKIGKALGIDETRVRIDVQLLHTMGFLAPAGLQIGVAAASARWRDAEPAHRYAQLVALWYALRIHPSIGRDQEGKVLPAAGPAAFGSAAPTRIALLALFEEIGSTSAVDNPAVLPELVGWHRPLMNATPAAIEAFWLEAHALGVLVDGAVSEIGRCLLDGDAVELRAVAAALLPPATSTGRFGSDLTVMVPGSPAAATSRLLDTCADREGRGAAVVWRFSAASVRRAFDEGWTADELIAALAAICDIGVPGGSAGGPGSGAAESVLPQTLTYLIADVARRHGHLVALPAGSCVRATDPALLREIVSHRSLAALRPYAIADTVAVFQQAPDAVILALRAAGYLPVPADRHGVVDLHRGRTDSPDGVPGRSAGRVAGRSTAGATDRPVGWSRGRRSLDSLDPLDLLTPARPSPEEELAGLAASLDLAAALLGPSAPDASDQG